MIVEAVVRGYYGYIKIWETSVGDELSGKITIILFIKVIDIFNIELLNSAPINKSSSYTPEKECANRKQMEKGQTARFVRAYNKKANK